MRAADRRLADLCRRAVLLFVRPDLLMDAAREQIRLRVYDRAPAG